MFLFKFLGFLWALPVSICGWLFMLFLTIFKQVSKVKITKDLIIIWKLKNGSFVYRKLFVGRGFIGFSLGNNIIYCESEFEDTILKHEKRHCQQYFLFGILFLPIYFIESLILYLFHKNLHPYYDNFFEIDARIFADQSLKVDWKDQDRWPW